MAPDNKLRQQLLASFREELAERLTSLNAGLLALESHPDPGQQQEWIEELFRDVHSLKGAARPVGLQPIVELAHGMEDVLGAAKRGTIRLTPLLFNLLYQGLDLISAVIAGHGPDEGEEPALDLPDYLVRLAEAWRGQAVTPPQIGDLPPASPFADLPAAPLPQGMGEGAGGGGEGQSIETIRVPTARLDDLMAQAGELLVARLRAAQQVEEIRELHAFVVRWQRDWRRLRRPIAALSRQPGNGSGARTGAPARAFLEQSEENLRLLATRLGDLSRQAADGATRLALVADELQDGVKRARMLPLATLLPSLRRAARDLAHDKGIEVVLEVHGTETELDKHVLEQVKDPLMHLVRNCIDHGIETPVERAAQGKLPQGTITLQAERAGNAVAIAVSDDGRGIDVAAVRSSAVRRGLVSKEAAAELDNDQATALIFSPGLSTSPIITEVSGRGVGLDVVRRNVEALSGRVDVHSTNGTGTRFTLTLPLTLVGTRCLFLRVGERTFAVPVASVERMVAVGAEDVAVVEGQEAINFLGQPLALVHLAAVLGLPDPNRPAEGKAPTVVLTADGQRIAFLVDALQGEQEIVVKSLGKQLARVPNVGGAAVLGSGKVVLVLNAADLVKSAQINGGSNAPRSPAEKNAPEAEQQVILVVDDSITTRTLEKNILTTAGYNVRLALDGQEALESLTEQGCDLIVADVDMPRMDGFDLTRRVKEDARYCDLPVILVTSLESPADRAKGIAVGADAYIIKSVFDQDDLLETIRQLI